MSHTVIGPSELFLQRVLSSRNPSHAYLFFGSPLSRKEERAKEFGKALLCERREISACGVCIPCRKIASGNHPDFRWIQPEGERIKIAQIRAIQGEIQYGPMEGRWKIILIPRAEMLTEEAAQSMLKMLEEPPERVIFLLVATHSAGMLPTIASRCQRVPFPPVPFSDKLQELTQGEHFSGEEAVKLLSLEVSEEETEEMKRFLRDLSPVLLSGIKETSEIFDRAALLEEYKEMGEKITRVLLAFCRDVAVCKAGWEEGVRFPEGKSFALRLARELSWEELWEKCRKILEAEDHLKHSGNFRLVMENLLYKLYM